jgi:hypothetical protein
MKRAMIKLPAFLDRPAAIALAIYLLAAVGAMLLATQTFAKEVWMPAPFIGEWCYETTYNDDPAVRAGGAYSYKLPSWMSDGETCDKNKILSITYYDFTFFDENATFVPDSVTVKEECAPSGCGQSAKIVARGFNSNKPRIFLIDRYKGHLSVEEAKGANQAQQIRCFWNPQARGCPKPEGSQ